MISKGNVRAIAAAVSLTLAHASAMAGPSSPADSAFAKLGRSEAIIGGDANAIIGGDTNAIIGGDARKAKRPNAIIGGDTDAIIGGDANAIIGGDTNAIIGGDARKAKRPNAIIGGDTDAIIGGDLLNKLSAGVVTHGPIESIDLARGQIRVLGQAYQGQAGSPALDSLAGQLAAGSTVLVTVTGTASQKGGSPRATAMSFSQEQYVAGATVVQVVGKVGKVSPELGSFKIGDLNVDYSSLLAQGQLTIRQGQVIAVAGVQASKAQPLQALAVVAL